MQRPFKFTCIHRITGKIKEQNEQPVSYNFEEWQPIDTKTSKKFMLWDFYEDTRYPAKLRLYNYIIRKTEQPKEPQPVMFAGIEVTAESIQAARLQSVANCLTCIKEAKNGTTRVNDLKKYIYSEKQHIRNILYGKSDNTFALLQNALYIQTGNCIALLP